MIFVGGEAFGAVEDGAVFAFGLAVVAADAEPFVFGEFFGEVFELMVECFLDAKDIGIHFADGFDDEVAAFVPILIAFVAPVVVADVVGDDGEVGGEEGGGEEEKENGEEAQWEGCSRKAGACRRWREWRVI